MKPIKFILRVILIAFPVLAGLHVGYLVLLDIHPIDIPFYMELYYVIGGTVFFIGAPILLCLLVWEVVCWAFNIAQ